MPPRYHHGDLRRALMQAALTRIEDGGLQGFSMSNLARDVGVSSGAPYRHFADKTALLNAIALEALELLFAMQAAEIEAIGDSPLQVFRAQGVAYVLFALRHPANFRVMCAPELLDVAAHPKLAPLLHSNNDAADALMAQAQQRGEVDPTHPAAATLTAQATMYGLARLFVDGRLTPLPEDEARTLVEQVTQVLGHGLAPRRPPE